MKKAIKFFVVLASALLAMQLAWAGDGISWNVTPGPDGTKRIETPDGVFIEETIGHHHWMGTEEEYYRRNAVSSMEGNGFREFPIKGRKKSEPIMFVYSWLPEAWVGSVHIGGIATYIYFDVKPDKTPEHPPKPEGSEYVDIGWMQSEDATVEAKIVDNETHKSYSPYHCGPYPDGSRGCLYIVPRESLGHPSNLVLTLGRNKPVQVSNESLALQYSKSILYPYKSGSRPETETEDAATLKKLHEIDSSIAADLPPTPKAMTERSHPREGCSAEQQVLTTAQFESIREGESLDQVQCIIGESTHKDGTSGGANYYWKMQGGGYALIWVSYAPSRVMMKRIVRRSPWEDW